MPGSQLLNRLQDLNYRVQAVANADSLVECAEQSKPMLVLADLESTRYDVCAALARLKQNPVTQHLPVIAFGGDNAPDLQAAARAAGVPWSSVRLPFCSICPSFSSRHSRSSECSQIR